jgi:putative SOS response-associated peptidase YedK
LFSFAGLWESWDDPQGEVVESCTILTTEANDVMRPLHDRMPVILDSSAFDLWLNPTASSEELRSLLIPFHNERMGTSPVSSWVNNAKHEGPRCLEGVDAA